jgi:acetyltransferase
MFAIRPVHPADRMALVEFYDSLSADTRYARFLGATRGLNPEQSFDFCAPDHMRAEGFVAVSERAADRGRLIGHICMVPADGRRVEVGVVVADGEQGRGIGRALFRAGVDWATTRSFEMIVASCLAGNTRVLSLLSSAPYGATIAPAPAGSVDVTVPLRATLPRDWSAPVSGFVKRPVSPRSHSGSCRAIWRSA